MPYQIVKQVIAFICLSLLLVLVYPQKAISNSDDAQIEIAQLMTGAGWRNIEIRQCRIRFEYGRVPPCDDGTPQFFEQEFRLQNVRWQDVSEIFADGTQTTTNWFVTFQPRGWYFQEVIQLPNVNAEIRREFPNSNWPLKLGPETKEISELIYSKIPRSSPYNWRFFHTCYGEVPTLEHGLMLIFEKESDAHLISDALVSYANSQKCPPDETSD